MAQLRGAAVSGKAAPLSVGKGRVLNSEGFGRRVSRRRFLGLGAAGAVALMAGCGTQQGQREVAEGIDAGYDQRFRPQYHFSPEIYWMNDPNGLVYYEGQYHLFFQHNPEGIRWGNISWGHAVSDDLYHWEQLPVALRPGPLGMIWSGSAVVDSRDSSGFFGRGNDGMVAFYTNAEDTNEDREGFEKQRQSLAYSEDSRTWTKYDGNPVIADPGIQDFRDPKVIWHEESGKWVLVLVAGEKVMFYGSRNLRDWTKLSEFGTGEGAHGGVWETPDLFELPVDGDSENRRWVLTLGINPGFVGGGSGEQYFVGEFDGETFTNSNPAETVLWADYGKDFYAAQSWSNLPGRAGLDRLDEQLAVRPGHTHLPLAERHVGAETTHANGDAKWRDPALPGSGRSNTRTPHPDRDPA